MKAIVECIKSTGGGLCISNACPLLDKCFPKSKPPEKKDKIGIERRR